MLIESDPGIAGDPHFPSGLRCLLLGADRQRRFASVAGVESIGAKAKLRVFRLSEQDAV
jgi:hypothetical protein